ncbi:GntR family transcriptional regulator [Neobacillus sp. OS1-2]|uniref:GntR family transcriptional regulator n=1 Tax=Neobacillus sp. OS1-2 TaxID=3070680 RepID=UPI0027DF4ACC|nr:GntR family transcriptional regulator [Neobacillus sp. OS1-2]WML39992.1 GntR family transcriptional regulator [Neobacillus sp. OS1-2]
MIIRIEPNADVPIYTQLTNQIIEGIARGEIQSGTALPSVRAFAADLGVNMHTVNKSYHELEKKGIIQIVPKSGAVIASSKEGMTVDSYSYQRISTELRPVIAEALVIGLASEQIQELITSIIHDLTED